MNVLKTNIVTTKFSKKLAFDIEKTLDVRQNPCENFYEYACSNNMNEFSVINNKNLNVVRALTEELNSEVNMRDVSIYSSLSSVRNILLIRILDVANHCC